jgi:hypothetical protein
MLLQVTENVPAEEAGVLCDQDVVREDAAKTAGRESVGAGEGENARGAADGA